MMTWVQDQLDDALFLPKKIKIPFPLLFPFVGKTLYLRAFIPQAHRWHHHFNDTVIQRQNKARGNTDLKQFFYFSQELQILCRRKIKPLSEIADQALTKDR
uniref:Uncharacterized protein n=1 Tax=Callorhinchus milii TaxID=7868 RepID=A0A4W3JB57_CALMI